MKRARAQRRPPPKEYRNTPELLPGLQYYYSAYETLRSCANINGDIPWTSVMEFSDRHGLTKEEADDLWILVRYLNLAELEYHNSKRGSTEQTGDSSNSATKLPGIPGKKPIGSG